MRKILPALVLVVLSAGRVLGGPADAAGLEFFEQKIRPVLVKHCYACHSVAAKKHNGKLLVDSREAIRKGGASGPAVVPGDPVQSLLIKAVRYDGIEMPPKEKGKLPARVIADLERWVKMGAPDPREKGATALVGDTWQQILKDRRRWWSLQPVRKAAVPAVKNADWSADPVDRFLLAEREKHRLPLIGEADRRTLLRRLSLVLTGLPPTPEEVDAFVADSSPAAYERQVDRLLASPHFGERFGRHWLDVVRFAETYGNEWNYEVSFAWCYRDYVIRAFNEDVPYDRLVREHLAGDMLSKPRRNRREGFNESPIGTMFYRFGDGNVEDCVEFPQVGFDVVDNRIDTLGKAFQATTIACARCHDHKLDAVSMKDYYALVGILHSSRQVTHDLDVPETNARTMEKLRELKVDLRKELALVWRREAAEIGRYLLAAQSRQAKAADADERARGLDQVRLQKWLEALKKTPAADDLLAPWRTASSTGAADFAAAWKKQAEFFATEQRERSAYNRENYRTFADFRAGSFAGWQVGGQGLRGGISPAGEFAILPEGDALLNAILPAGCFTHTLSDRLNGTLRSPLLPGNAGKRISFEVLGRHHSDIAVIAHHCQLADANWQRLGDDRPYWVTLKVPDDPVSFRAYAELTTKFDNPKFPDPIVKGNSKDKEDYRVPWDQAASKPRSFFGITRAVLHEGSKPPKPELGHFGPLFAGPAPATVADAADRYAAVVGAAVQSWAAGRITDEEARWIDGLLQRGLLGNRVEESPRLAELAQQYRALEKELKQPRIVHGMGDFGPGFEQPLFVRGDCARPSERVPRGYLEVLSKPGERFAAAGSGRRELAERIARADNPLTARVMVNRLWQHVFGQGLVRTVDDFGHNGDRPSHPELLDYLAARFVEDGWSTKRLIRGLVLTRTFRQGNRPTAMGRAADPENRWLHHFAARRMEAEAIRDAILFASGRLDRAMFGPSVDPFRERQIPHQRLFIGPLDGKGRRSLYVKHTLMEPPKFLEAFNLPKGVVMQGRRDVTNVPAQALALLNDPFLLDQAGVWAERLTTRRDRSVSERIDYMFRVALGRAPDREEKVRFETAVRRLAELHDVGEVEILASKAVWKDVAHTLFNLKEFIYIP